MQAFNKTIFVYLFVFKQFERFCIPISTRSVAAVISCNCFNIVAAVILSGPGTLFLLFVLLYSQGVASHSCKTCYMKHFNTNAFGH